MTRHSLGRICASFLALRTKTTLTRITRTPSSFPTASGFLWTMQLVLITSRWEQTSGHATTNCALEWKRFRRALQHGIGMSIPSLKAIQHPVDQLLCRGRTTSMPLRIFTVPWSNIHLTMEPFSLTFPRTLFPHLSAAITDPPNQRSARGGGTSNNMQVDKALNPVSEIDARFKLLSQDHQPSYIEKKLVALWAVLRASRFSRSFSMYIRPMCFCFCSCTQHFRITFHRRQLGVLKCSNWS